jgi:hypothetical protein
VVFTEPRLDAGERQLLHLYLNGYLCPASPNEWDPFMRLVEPILLWTAE